MDKQISKSNAIGEILTKNSSEEQIRAYFECVLELYKSGEKYPVDLDAVWMLVYSDKGKAVRALKKGFIENDDFIRFTQNGERGENGRFIGSQRDIYKLTTSCMEYFIAKKVRGVFNVYREVFKKFATGEVIAIKPELSELEILVKASQALLEQSKRMDGFEKRLETIERDREESSRLMLSAEISTEQLPEETENAKIRKLVHMYVKSTGMSYEDVWNGVYETLEYRYGNRIRAYKKLSSDKSLLDVAIRNNLGQKVFNVISDMVRNVQQ